MSIERAVQRRLTSNFHMLPRQYSASHNIRAKIYVKHSCTGGSQSARCVHCLYLTSVFRRIYLVNRRFNKRGLQEFLKLLGIEVANTDAPNNYNSQRTIFE